VQPIPASKLLEVWERGEGLPHLQRALVLLSAACPDVPQEALAEYSIGRRDACLLSLRERTFGSKLTGLSRCPRCGVSVELSLDVSDIRNLPAPESAQPLRLSLGPHGVDYRLPNTHDLIALGANTDPDAGWQRLLARCVIDCYHDGKRTAFEDLPGHVVQAVVNAMGKADSQTDVRVELDCPACAHRWQSPFDIVSFFWREINSWARRTLREVHLLASAYGWREADILAMSPLRRQLYLEMAGQ
jgi:hypothetical protein